MSFGQVYTKCINTNTLKVLVYREGNVDHLIGYRIFSYNPVDDSSIRRDFALDVDALLKFPNGEVYHRFLKEVTPKLVRVQLVPDGKGGLTTKAELASGKRVSEISGKDLISPLESVIKSFVLSGMYDLKKCKGF